MTPDLTHEGHSLDTGWRIYAIWQRTRDYCRAIWEIEELAKAIRASWDQDLRYLQEAEQKFWDEFFADLRSRRSADVAGGARGEPGGRPEASIFPLGHLGLTQPVWGH